MSKFKLIDHLEENFKRIATSEERSKTDIKNIYMPKILSVRDGANYLGIHPQNLKRLIKKGEIKGFLVGSRWKVTVRDLHEYIESKTLETIIPKK